MTVALKFDSATAVRSLLDATSYERNIDGKLQFALETALMMLKSDALLCCYGINSGEISITTSNSSEPCEISSTGLMDVVQKKWPLVDHLGSIQGIIAIEFRDRPHLFVPCQVRATDEWGRELKDQPSQYVLFSFPKRTSLVEYENSLDDVQVRNNLVILARTICFAVRMRSNIYSRFPSNFGNAYWNFSLSKRNMVKCDDEAPRIAPPWNMPETGSELAPGLRSTVTLSFDLRRSTRAMEKSLDLKAYADWIEAMVLVLHRIATDNNGIFDKFTGDGALVHFLVDECDLLPIQRPILAGLEERVLGENEWRTSASKHGHRAVADALACSFEMLWAIDEHAKRLSQITRIGDKKFGPAVAIAKGNVQWSVDRDGNPIVVGLSVVDACRITDITERGVVCVSPHVNQLLKEAGVIAEHELVDFHGKESTTSDDDYVFSYCDPPEGLCRSKKDVSDCMLRIRNEVDRRASFLGVSKF